MASRVSVDSSFFLRNYGDRVLSDRSGGPSTLTCSVGTGIKLVAIVSPNYGNTIISANIRNLVGRNIVDSIYLHKECGVEGPDAKTYVWTNENPR
jgi:hypothetical protein